MLSISWNTSFRQILASGTLWFLLYWCWLLCTYCTVGCCTAAVAAGYFIVIVLLLIFVLRVWCVCFYFLCVYCWFLYCCWLYITMCWCVLVMVCVCVCVMFVMYFSLRFWCIKVVSVLYRSIVISISQYSQHHCFIINWFIQIPLLLFIKGSADKTVKIWDVTTQTCSHTFTHHTDKV